MRLVRFIKRAQELGFSLRDIRELIELRPNPAHNCDDHRVSTPAGFRRLRHDSTMPWTASYLADGAYVRFSGATTGDEIIRANTEFYQQAYKAGPRFAVFDFSEIERFDVDYSAIERVAAQDVVAAAAAIPDLAVAVVAPQLIAYGMSRMWEMQVAETGWRTKVARSRAEAFSWLEHEGIPTDRFAALRD